MSQNRQRVRKLGKPGRSTDPADYQSVPRAIAAMPKDFGAGFEIAPADEAVAARIGRGTEIVLHLKDDAAKYLDAFEIERIVRTYSDHILFPIELVDEKGEARQINSASALWQRTKSEVKPEDYTQAYRSIATAFDEPALTLHYKVEGRQ